MDLSKIESIKGGLIVSCQASKGEPLCHPEHILALALTVLRGGACGLRLEGAENIEVVRKSTDVPIVGITKTEGLTEEERLDRAYITPSFEEARRVARAGADIIAADATGREREDGLKSRELFSRIHDELDKPVWADVSTIEEAREAVEAGADIISTTLFGYSRHTLVDRSHGPGFDLLRAMVDEFSIPVILEGRVWSIEDVCRGFELGAHAVVVGSAITRPHLITQRFVDAISKRQVQDRMGRARQ